MRAIGMKGSFAVMVAAVAVLLTIFMANSAMLTQGNSSTFTKMQAYQEAAIKSGDAIRVLGIASAVAVYNKNTTSSPACATTVLDADVKTAFDVALNDFNKLSSVPCKFSLNPVSGSNPVTISGNVWCVIQIKDSNVVSKRGFYFIKQAWNGPSSNCDVNDMTDTTNGCRELPNLSVFTC